MTVLCKVEEELLVAAAGLGVLLWTILAFRIPLPSCIGMPDRTATHADGAPLLSTATAAAPQADRLATEVKRSDCCLAIARKYLGK